MADLKLIYINEMGPNFRGLHVYEFLFAEKTDNVDSDDWDAVPAGGQPQPPHEDYIERVGVLITELKFDLAQNDNKFAMWDAVDGIIPLGWENLDEYDEYPDDRLFFRFGEDMNLVDSKLYERDLSLGYNDLKKMKRSENY